MAEPLYVARSEVFGLLDESESGRGADATRRRTAYAMAVLLGLGLPRAGDGRIATELAPWETPLAADTHALAARLGLGVRDCAAALDLLRDGGAIVSASEGVLTLARALFRTRPAADAVDWDRVLVAIEGSAPSVLTAWAFAELLVRPDRFASVPRAELVAHTLYGEGMVKRALASLVAAGVIDRSGSNAYRFSDAALGRAPFRAPTPPAGSTAPPAPIAAAYSSGGAPAPGAAAGKVSFTAAGIPLELPRDVTIELEAEVDGRPTKLRLRFPSG